MENILSNLADRILGPEDPYYLYRCTGPSQTNQPPGVLLTQKGKRLDCSACGGNSLCTQNWGPCESMSGFKCPVSLVDPRSMDAGFRPAAPATGEVSQKLQVTGPGSTGIPQVNLEARRGAWEDLPITNLRTAINLGYNPPPGLRLKAWASQVLDLLPGDFSVFS
ncbi:hypothetical protein GF362_01940 [Candidatus Dojkabacteria bacterium]|nr:hypothetical protein [Candidatus Dojkabacteria bacterium]